jgi:hypothetical protein
MAIYQVQNKYFVEDDTTVASGQELNIPNAVFAVGDINAANQALVDAQQAYLARPETLNHFSCVKSIGKDLEGHNLWVPCVLAGEIQNTDTLYELFCDVDPGFKLATGTDEAQAIYAQLQQSILQWAGLNQVTTLTELPKAPKPVV